MENAVASTSGGMQVVGRLGMDDEIDTADLVLLVDTDAQGNVSVSLNAETQRTLYHVLVMGLPVSDVATTVRPNLDIVGSNETLAARSEL